MDAKLLAFQQAGAANANEIFGETVTVVRTSATLTGVKTDLENQPHYEFGGFEFKNIFSLLVNNPLASTGLRVGEDIVDAQGVVSQLLKTSSDHIHTLFFFGTK